MVGKHAEKVDGEMVLRVALRALECKVRNCCARGPGTKSAGSAGGGSCDSEGCCEEGSGAPLESGTVVSEFDAGAVPAISVSFGGASGAVAAEVPFVIVRWSSKPNCVA